jgi:5-(carboxyamino)imidazole ribonucleotide synthase
VSTFFPPASLGFVGGGQLARMMAAEARRMGYRTVVLDPDKDCPAAANCDEVVAGDVTNPKVLADFGELVDVITLDHEHVRAELLDALSSHALVRPAPSVLRTVQDRLVQREFIAGLGIKSPGFMAIHSRADLHAAAQRFGFPLVMKTRREGYDGKGQLRIHSEANFSEAEAFVDAADVLVESFVRFEREISVVLARSVDGQIEIYPIADNHHERHVLRTTRAPAEVTEAVVEEACRIAVRIAEAFAYVGVLAVELFLTAEGEVLVNEIAPRVHNSGHYTQGACATSQFEQHVRAVMGVSLGDARMLSPAVMINLFGDLWHNGAPNFEAVLARRQAKLHLYGKHAAKPGRKMGHVVVLEPTLEAAVATGEALRLELEG